MGGSRFIFLIVVAALAGPSARAAELNPGCIAQLRVADGPAPSALDYFPPWKLGKDLLPFSHVMQLLPSSTIAKLEEAGIHPRLMRSQYSVAIVGDTDDDLILTFELMKGSRSDTIQVTGLEGADLSNLRSRKIKQGKERRGLGAEVFRYAEKQIEALARSGGFTGIEAFGTADYLVHLLYRRLGGLDFTTDWARETFRGIDSGYAAASKFPDGWKITSLDAFSRALGSFYGDSPDFLAMDSRLEKLLAGRAPGWTPVRLENEGRLIAVGAIDPEGRKVGPFFLYRTPEGERRLISWSSLARNHGREMVLRKDLAPPAP